MIYFLYGEDSYRSRQKLNDIIDGYKKVHKSGLNLVYIDAERADFKSLLVNFKVASMFAEKKLVVLKNVFSNQKFQEEFLKELKNLEELKDIILIYENSKVDERLKLLKQLKASVKCQEFSPLSLMNLKKWVQAEFAKNGSKTDFGADDLLLNFTGNDLWRLENEIKKLCNYKNNSLIKKEDVLLHVKPKIETDIFKTIDALAQKNKKLAINLLNKHIEDGEVPLYLISMIAYQFRNLLILKELAEKQKPNNVIASKSGLHPFVVKKSLYLCNHFSLSQLKNIYKNIFKIDSDIKTGRMDADAALDLVVASI